MAGDLMIYHATEAARPLPCPGPALSVVMFGKPKMINADLVRRPHWFFENLPSKSFSRLPASERRALMLKSLSNKYWVSCADIADEAGCDASCVRNFFSRDDVKCLVERRGGRGVGFQWRLK